MITRRRALAAGLSLLPVASLSPSVAATSAPLTEGRIRLPSGRRIGYAEYGNPSGLLVLYFHGTPGSRVEARLIEDEGRASGVRLVAIERPGIGLSDYKSGRRILDWPADVECAVESLGYAGTSFGIVAVSGGAPYALACIKCIPHRLTHVAIASGHTPPHAQGVRPGNQDRLISFVARRSRLSTVGLNVAIRTLRRNPDRMARRVMQSWAESDRQLIHCSREHYATLIRTLNEATRCGSAGILRDVQLLGSPWGFRLCDLPPASVSIWHGGCDPIAPLSMGEYFHRQVPGSELIVDPAAGHLTMPKWHALEILARFQIGG
jgi:pimeloyl-ACP methyl ester carboxylesterase